MVITELAKAKIEELLHINQAKFLNISLAGNAESGFQTIITFDDEVPKEFITIITSPLVFISPRAYINFANTILDFDAETDEIKIKF